MRIAVLGAGAWGTALACSAAGAHEVMLWARDPRQAEVLQQQRRNQRYLPDVPLAPALRVTASHDEALRHVLDAGEAGLIVVATPMGALRSCLGGLPAQLAALWLCKGFEAGSGALGHEIAREVRPAAPGGVLSGPSFALEVARGQPTALVAASDDPAVIDKAVAAFHGDSVRVYRSDDPVGVEVGGAVKNVMAIACGILDGLAERAGPGAAGTTAPGLNARAALITRGLAEMTRLGVALGADPATFMGLSGLGDLVLTATGGLSRNRQVGLALAAGRTLPQILEDLGHVAEGVYSAHTVLERARSLGIDMPITEAVVGVLESRLTPVQAIGRLMSRQATSER